MRKPLEIQGVSAFIAFRLSCSDHTVFLLITAKNMIIHFFIFILMFFSECRRCHSDMFLEKRMKFCTLLYINISDISATDISVVNNIYFACISFSSFTISVNVIFFLSLLFSRYNLDDNLMSVHIHSVLYFLDSPVQASGSAGKCPSHLHLQVFANSQ